MWLLPEVCCISFRGKACSSFTDSTGIGSRTRKRLFTGWYSLESVCVCSEAGESNRSPGSRIREADTGERVGQIPGGTSNLEGACYFWYLLYVVHFYTDWKNKVRWDCRKISLAWSPNIIGGYLRVNRRSLSGGHGSLKQFPIFYIKGSVETTTPAIIKMRSQNTTP